MLCLFVSPQEKAVIKTAEDYLQSPFGPSRLLHSAAVPEGSGLQDCSTHQTTSDHSHDEISALDSYKSNSKNNSCLIAASKRNRPVSAPVGQLRIAEFSSLKFQSAQSCHRMSQRHKLQPRMIRVTAYKNGSRTIFAKVIVPTITLLLEECTAKLNLSMAARRVFLADGTEVLKPKDIPQEVDVYVSTGEPFKDPFKKIKDHLLLMKKVTWTMNGLMLPTDVKRQKTKPVLSTRMKKLTEKISIRILFFKNGMGQDGCEISVGEETVEKVLDTCTMKMDLNSPARYLYDLYGRKIEDISHGQSRHFAVIPQDDEHKGKEARYPLYVLQAFQKAWGRSFGHIHLNLQECGHQRNGHSSKRHAPQMLPRQNQKSLQCDPACFPLLEKCLQNSITPLRGPVWVSKGEGFSPSGAKMYIQGVLLALSERLKSAKNYYKQYEIRIAALELELRYKKSYSET
ncbi:PREDICTED: doublecortin domain-containing protein 1 [Chrysochloris asiatica]|uniref:Doublecortin domain-containing protein 1 n=1 Tax=Chrysochloris asiatica TaxID=185453 RepID=A0A9B0TNZ2_CHRAS|nr:PREDICTED: doublecortin domain-containing protein 1 [Chrysochloris asiatica]